MSDYSNYVIEELEKSQRALEDAEKMQDASVSDEAVVSRLYYALYHSIKAALYSKGLNHKTHAGLVSQFGEHLLEEDGITKEDAKFVSISQTRREEADYDYNPEIEEDIETILNKTKQVIDKMENLAESEIS